VLPLTERLLKFQVLTPCAGCFESCCTFTNVTSGSFSDGSGTSNYPNGADCRWIIAAPNQAASVKLTFSSFDTEEGYDFVTLSSCTSIACENPLQIAELSGSAVIGGSGYISTTGISLSLGR
jgi:hypothetical protein